MFLGESPASSNRQVVRIDSVGIGERYDYSGANFLMVQAIIEHFAEGGFDGQTARLLSELNMRSSTFDDRFLPTLMDRYARGHSSDSTNTVLTKKDVLIFPNKAAANLKTTATDLAQFVIMLNQGGEYAGRRVLREETVNRMLRGDAPMGSTLVEQNCTSPGTSGLAMEINNSGYWHSGTHNGFRAFIYGYPLQDAGLILLMTGTRGNANNLRSEIRLRFSALYL
jgi:CubicO group peptidase (beta-lactamase class C family)